MKELLDSIERWRAAGKRVALARVVRVEGSGPRLPGAAMAVSDCGEVVGSLSGGCVEGAVFDACLDVLLSRRARPQLLRYGLTDDDFSVGLTCGGSIEVFVEALDSWPVRLLEALERALAGPSPVALVTVVDGPSTGTKLLVQPRTPAFGSTGDRDLDRAVARDAVGELGLGLSTTRHYGAHGEACRRDVSVFVESFVPPPRLVIFGAMDFTAALVRVAKVLGHHVTVCDARAPFASAARFPEADEVVVDWPDRHLAEIGDQLGPRDAVCVLTHDPKFDVPAILAALDTEVGYVGAMGSRLTCADRLARLEETGIDPVQLHRLMAPIGLDIGARTPEEVAVAICAEIVGLRSGHCARSLRDSAGPIHA